jgi:pimeloyl-ACP methyl ester carboxylesterase
MSLDTSESYDEFSLFADNASDAGLPYDRPPTVLRAFVEVNPNQRMSLLVWGDGPPQYVFIHGGAQNAHTWDTTILAMGRPNAIAVDLPGHGHSDWRDDRNYHPETNAAAVATVVSQYAPNATAVIGMSLGGLTSMVLASRWRELVRKLVVVDVTPGTNREKSKRITDFVRGPESFESFEALLARTIEHNPGRSESSLRRGILHNARPREDGSWVWRYDRFRSEEPPEAAGNQPPQDQPAVDFQPMWDDVAKIRCPILLLIGGAWSVVDGADIAAFTRRQPTTRVVTVDGAGHSIQGDRPVVLARLITEFAPAG